MIYSNERKLILSGWLQENRNSAYCSPLRLQKYLFFYEALCKTADEPHDFDRLRGYKRGPVFSTVWGDYTKNRDEFDESSQEYYHRSIEQVIPKFARKASFIVSSLSEDELSKLTHQYHIWNAKSDRIMAGEQQVDLSESDFNQEDYRITESLQMIYPDSMVADCEIVPVGEKYFVFSKNDMVKLTEQHADTLSALAGESELQNPVFVTIDEGGGLIVD